MLGEKKKWTSADVMVLCVKFVTQAFSANLCDFLLLNLLKNIYFYFMCIGVFLACKSMHHVQVSTCGGQ